jgi:hypothetical protein
MGSSSRSKDDALKINNLEGVQIGADPPPTLHGTAFETIGQLAERRRIQNRIAQRSYRKNLKKKLEELERRATEGTDMGKELIHMRHVMALNELDDEQLDRALEEPPHSKSDNTFTGMDWEQGHIDTHNRSVHGPHFLLDRSTFADVHSIPHEIVLPKSPTKVNAVEDAISIVRGRGQSTLAVNKDISSLNAHLRSLAKSEDSQTPTSTKSQTASSLIEIDKFSTNNRKSPALTLDRKSRTCTACRFQKVKCDGVEPTCSACLKTRSQCQYPYGTNTAPTLKPMQDKDNRPIRSQSLQALSCTSCQANQSTCDRARPICSNCLKAGSLKLCKYRSDGSEQSTYRIENRVNDKEIEVAQRIKTLQEVANAGQIDRETFEKLVLEIMGRASTPAFKRSGHTGLQSYSSYPPNVELEATNASQTDRDKLVLKTMGKLSTPTFNQQSHTGLLADSSHSPPVELEPGVLIIDGQVSFFEALQQRETQDRPGSRDQPDDLIAHPSSAWPIIALASNEPTWRERGAANSACQTLPATTQSPNTSLTTKAALTLVSPLRKESLASLEEVHKPTIDNREHIGPITRATTWVNDQWEFQLQDNVGVEMDAMESEHKSESGSHIEKKFSTQDEEEFENLSEYASTINPAEDAISTVTPPSLINTSAYENSAQSGVSTSTLRGGMPSQAYHKEHPSFTQMRSERSGISTSTLKDPAYGKTRRTHSPFSMEGESDIGDAASQPSTLKLSTAVQSRYVRTPDDVESPYDQMRRLSVKAAELITQPGQRKSPSSGRAASSISPSRSHDISLQRDQMIRYTQPSSSVSHALRLQTTSGDEYEVDDDFILNINSVSDSSSDSSSDIYSSFSHLKATDSEMMEAYHHELQSAPATGITNQSQLGAIQDTGSGFSALTTNTPSEFFAPLDLKVVFDMSEPDEETTSTEYPPSFWRAVKVWRSKASQSSTSVSTGVGYETDGTSYTEGSSKGHATGKYKKKTWALQFGNMPALAEESSDEDYSEWKKGGLAGKSLGVVEPLTVEPLFLLQEVEKEACIHGNHIDLKHSQWDADADEAETFTDNLELEPAHLFPGLTGTDWKDLQTQLPESWMWDVDYHNSISPTEALLSGCWTCTPLNDDDPRSFPLTIAGAPVILPVEYTWPPVAGVNPPPDPRPSAPIDCTAEVPLEVIRDLFLTFEGSLGFYLLMNGVLQIIVSKEFNKEWASSHLPHKYGGLKVCYIAKNMEPTMLPSTATLSTKTDTMKSKSSQTSTAQNSISGLSSSSSFFRPSSKVFTGLLPPSLQLNDFIEARTKSSHRKEKFAGRIGAKVVKNGEPYLVMSSHVVTEAILAKSHRAALFGRNKDRFEKLDGDWNEHIEIWAGNEKVRL